MATGLHICPDCSSELVYPVQGEEAGDHAWRVWRRCPECEWAHEGVFGDAEIDLFDRELDRGTELLAHHLHYMEMVNFESFAQRFVQALEQDLIGAEDFSRRVPAQA